MTGRETLLPVISFTAQEHVAPVMEKLLLVADANKNLENFFKKSASTS